MYNVIRILRSLHLFDMNWLGLRQYLPIISIYAPHTSFHLTMSSFFSFLSREHCSWLYEPIHNFKETYSIVGDCFSSTAIYAYSSIRTYISLLFSQCLICFPYFVAFRIWISFCCSSENCCRPQKQWPALSIHLSSVYIQIIVCSPLHSSSTFSNASCNLFVFL